MTFDRDDDPDGEVSSVLSSLPHHDVSRSRARRLRERCHAMLQPEPRAAGAARLLHPAPLRRLVVPAIGAAWCVAYLAEITRCTAAVYAYFGTQ